MDHVSIRPFGTADLTPIVRLWNQSLTKDPITEERFWHLVLLDPNFDPEGALVAEVDGVPVGFLHVMVRRHPMGAAGIEPELGWITCFFVGPGFRRREIGTALLDAGLTFLRGRGRCGVWCNGYAPIYLFPGVDEDYAEAHAFLQARGFAPAAEAVAMSMALDGIRMPEAVAERLTQLRHEGFEVRTFCRGDTLPLIAFCDRYFPEYGDTIRDGLQHGNLEIVVATYQGEVAGFTQWENTYTDPPAGAEGRFGPFGIRPDLRSRGLGSAVFYTLIERLVARGVHYLWFGWAGGRNLSFYERAGCRVTRRYRLYRREL